MKDTLRDLLTSKKFLAALTAVIVYAAGRFGFDVDTSTLDHIFAALLVYVGAQGAADVGKSAALVRAATPAPSGMAIDATPPRNSQSGKVGGEVLLTVAFFAALALAGGMVATSCTATQARQTAATGTVAALDCEFVHVDQAVLDDLRHVAEGKVQAWISGAAPANMGALINRVKADLGVFKSDAGRCAVAGAVAAATTIASPTPGEAVQGLTAAPTGPDPVAVRAAFSTAARELGVPPLKVAGAVL